MMCSERPASDDHHVSYTNDETVPICETCHFVIHHGEGGEEFAPDDDRDDYEETTVSVRMASALWQGFEGWCEQQGYASRSAGVRALIRQALGSEGCTGLEDKQLRRSLQSLREMSHPEDHTVPGTIAISKLAQDNGLNKEGVRACILRPLDNSGYITARNGTLVLTEKGRGEA